jgi:hypothetical protein
LWHRTGAATKKKKIVAVQGLEVSLLSLETQLVIGPRSAEKLVQCESRCLSIHTGSEMIDE